MNILLTGATGFVGKQLTVRLLESGNYVYAIVRNEKKGEMLRASIHPKFRENLTIIEGNISEHLGGIKETDINLLSDKIHTVYHSAAYLSFDPADKEKTFQVNLDGTKNILDFARKIRVKRFFYISTAYTLGETIDAKEELHPTDRTFVNFYEESKCHAEHLVFEYQDYFDVSIFRPSIIIGDSETGEADTTFALHGIIRSFEILKKREKRKRDMQNDFRFLCNDDSYQNFVPVDYVVKVLYAALSHAKKDTIYHITNDNPPNSLMILDLIKFYLDLHHVVMVPTSYKGELTSEEQKFNSPLQVFYKYMERSVRFDDSNTKQLLKESNMEPLNFNEKMLGNIISKNVSDKYKIVPST